MSLDHSFDRTYEILDLDNPPPMPNESDTHFIFCCPNCITKKGTADESGNLWFDKNELKGICFRCNTAFFPEIKDDETGLTDPKLNHVVDIIHKKLAPKYFFEPTPMAFNFDELKAENIKYLKSRHPFLAMLAPILGLKAWSGTKNGIVIPYLYKDFIATFQVRFDTTDPKGRYYIPKNSEKIPYSPEHLLTHFNLGDEAVITICEGWADAVALWILGYPHPIAIQGSTLSESQVPLIRRLMPEQAFVVMDDWDKSVAVSKDMKKKIPSISATKIVCYGENVDPEEHLKKEIKDPDKLRFYFNHTVDILRDRVK